MPGLLERFAPLFGYPDTGYGERLAACLEAAPSAELAAFAAAIGPLRLERLQEVFIEAFDWTPDTSLDIGWHLFGENYDRGEFLVRLRGELRRYGVPESAELPDHLPHVLALLDRMPEEEAGEFAGAFLRPALDKLVAGFQNKSNPFGHLVAALRQSLAARNWAPVSVGGPHE